MRPQPYNEPGCLDGIPIVADTKTGCWIWTGAKTNGYGRISRGRHARISAQRHVWEAVNGAVPQEKMLDHLCRVRACVNPSHLEVVTNKENVLRGVGPSAVAARKTTCDLGHPLVPYKKPATRAFRHCQICRNEHQRNKYWLNVSETRRKAREQYQANVESRRLGGRLRYWRDPEKYRAKKRVPK